MTGLHHVVKGFFTAAGQITLHAWRNCQCINKQGSSQLDIITARPGLALGISIHFYRQQLEVMQPIQSSTIAECIEGHYTVSRKSWNSCCAGRFTYKVMDSFH
jgi:hypothetical protein